MTATMVLFTVRRCSRVSRRIYPAVITTFNLTDKPESPKTISAEPICTAPDWSKARFPFKRNRLRFVRCVKFSPNKRKRQPIGMLGRSSGNHDWLLANASACASCGFRLRNARNASDCV